METNFEEKRQQLIATALIPKGITSTAVLGALGKVKREKFIPINLQQDAYENKPLSIGEGQTISQPYIVAYMTQALEINPSHRVLEIGTGSGYQTAILAEICKNVFTIERIETLSKTAQKTLRELGYKNINFLVGDGFKGWSEYAPYDRIILTAAPVKIPTTLFDQLSIGGILIAPAGDEKHQRLFKYKKTDSGISCQSLFPVIFVPMIEGN